MRWRSFIDFNNSDCIGLAYCKGTQVPALLVISFLSSGRSTYEIQQKYPDVTEAHIDACEAYWIEIVAFEDLIGEHKEYREELTIAFRQFGLATVYPSKNQKP